MHRFFIHTCAASLLGLASVAPSAVHAADHEVSYEVGTLAIHDPAWDLFDASLSYLPSQGVRLGYAVHDRVAVIGGWHHAARGQTLYTEGEEDDESTFAAAFYSETFLAGAKADWDLAPWFRPYAAAQFMGVLGTVRLDDDTTEDDNLNQITRRAFTPGAVATGGVDIRVPFADGRYAVASYMEFGYGRTLNLSFEDLGDLDMAGFAFRWGIGARF